MVGFAFIYPGGKLRLYADETANDSDKTITVPDGKRWWILWIHADFTSTGGAGNRTMTLEITDDSNDEIYRMPSGFAQPASEQIFYHWLPGVARDATDPGTLGATAHPLPQPCILPAGYKIRIADDAAIAVNADDLVIQMMVMEIDD